MAVQYTCDVCGQPIATGEALQKKITFVGKSSTFMAVAYMPDKKDYCLSCAQSEAAPFRRKRGRPTIVRMHLTREQVAEVLPLLLLFVQTGEIDLGKGRYVQHVDGNLNNNDPANLRIVTIPENKR